MVKLFNFKKKVAEQPKSISEDVTWTEAEANEICNNIKNGKLDIEQFKTSPRAMKKVLEDKELFYSFLEAYKKDFSNKSITEVLGLGYSAQILTKILENYGTDSKAMKFFAEQYKQVPELLLSDKFISLITTANYENVKNILIDAFKTGIISVLAKKHDVETAKSINIFKKAIKHLEKDIEFYYNNENTAYLFSQAIGLNTRLMSAEEAEKIINAEKSRQEKGIYPPAPEEDQMMMIRVTDVFPTNNTIRAPKNSNGVNSKDNILSKTIDRAVDKFIAEKYGITEEELTQIMTWQITEQDWEILKRNNTKIDKNITLDELAELLLQDYSNEVHQKSKILFHSSRETIHFTLNTTVAEHGEGNEWNSMPFAIIEPYRYHKKELENLRPEDSWICGDVSLQKPTIEMEEEYLKVLIEKSKSNKDILETLKSCEIVIIKPNENIPRSSFVNAILLKKGCPAYECSNFFVNDLVKNNKKPAIHDAIDREIRDFNKEIERETEKKTSIPHNQISVRHYRDQIFLKKAEYQSFYNFAKYFIKKAYSLEQQTIMLEKLKAYKLDIDQLTKIVDKYNHGGEMLDFVMSEDMEYERRLAKSLVDFKQLVTEIVDSSNLEADAIQTILAQYNQEFQNHLDTIYPKSIMPTKEVDLAKIAKYREKLNLQKASGVQNQSGIET